MRIKQLLEKMVNDQLPDRAVIFLDYDALIEVFTKKRLELIRTIDKRNPKSVQELAQLVNRKKQAVHRDLKILEGHKLITFEKKGRTTTPIIYRDAIIIKIRNNKNLLKNNRRALTSH